MPPYKVIVSSTIVDPSTGHFAMAVANEETVQVSLMEIAQAGQSDLWANALERLFDDVHGRSLEQIKQIKNSI